METIFIVNPMAGQGKIEKITQKIKSLNAKMYITKSVGDAERFVKEKCTDKPSVRFISCGGDGTFNEVLNGAIDNENAEIGIVPIGTGNDFCRNFDCDFNDISALLDADTVKCDAIRYVTGDVTRYCANMFNIGFDCNVADLTTQMKKKTFISGPLVYFISILLVLIKKKGADLKVEIDDKTVYDGPLLLTSIANGKFCGGGIKSNPEALLSDGEMNINIVKNIKRLKLLTILPRYMNGTHMSIKNIKKIIHNQPCKKVVISPNSPSFRICCDGEIQDASDVTFEVLNKAFNFVLPIK